MGNLFAKMLPWLFAGFRKMFNSRLGLWIMSAMVWLGINFGTIKLVLEPTIDALRGAATGLGGGGEMFATAQAWAGVMKFDKGLTMIISAYVTKHAIMKGRLFLFKKGL
jgi:hypothetical protein